MTAQILVVDDEPDLESLVVQKFRRLIKDGAVSFTFVHDGVQALAALKSNSGFDLVVTDINMPRMDGLTLLQKLHEARRRKLAAARHRRREKNLSLRQPTLALEADQPVTTH